MQGVATLYSLPSLEKDSSEQYGSMWMGGDQNRRIQDISQLLCEGGGWKEKVKIAIVKWEWEVSVKKKKKMLLTMRSTGTYKNLTITKFVPPKLWALWK